MMRCAAAAAATAAAPAARGGGGAVADDAVASTTAAEKGDDSRFYICFGHQHTTNQGGRGSPSELLHLNRKELIFSSLATPSY